MTAYQHLIAHNFAWSAWTFVVTLIPGAINYIQEEYFQDKSRGWSWWLLMIPNLATWSVLFQVRVIRSFYISLFEPNDLAISVDKEELRRVACNKYVDSMNKTMSKKNMEAFLEAGMQLCLQSYIIARKGEAPVIQLISLLISFMTLSKACSENHITTQSMLLPTSFMQTLKTAPLFLSPCISKVLTIAIVTAFNAVIPGFGLILPVMLFVFNTSVIWWIMEETLSKLEYLMSGLCCLLTTTIMIKESSKRIVQIDQLRAYAATQTLSSAISIIWLCVLSSHNQPNTPETTSQPDQVLIIPAYQNIQQIIIILIILHIFSALSFTIITLLYSPGKGLVEQEYKGECPPELLKRYGHSHCNGYVTTCVSSAHVSYNMPDLAVGANSTTFPTGATLRASLDVFKGDYLDQELTFCRFDKILVLPWRDDGKHHNSIWLRGRIVSFFMDEEERRLRYGIHHQDAHTEGYFPANIVFYDLIQPSPPVSWWWVRAADQAPLLSCCSPSKAQCSRHHSKGETAGVPYHCTTCGVAELCGWCWVVCHTQHQGGASLVTQGSYAVPWAGKQFSCTCDCCGVMEYP